MSATSTTAIAEAHVLSWSRIDLLRRCPLRYKRRYIDRVAEPATAPLDRGKEFHSWAQHVAEAMQRGEQLDDDVLYQMCLARAALLEEEAAEDLRGLVRYVIERDLLPRFPSDAEDVAFERRFALDDAGQETAWDDPDALFRGILDQSFRENGGRLAVIRDFKTSRAIEETDQLRFYAWAETCLHPDVEDVVTELHFVRFGAVRRSREPFAAAELRATVPLELRAIRADLDHRLATGDWTPRVTEIGCRTCSFRSSCQEFQGEIQPLAVIESAEAAVAASQQLVRLRGQAMDLESELRAWVRQHGPVAVGDEQHGYLARPRTHVVDAHAAARRLKTLGVPDDQIWSAMALPKGSLGKLLTTATRSAPRAERRDAREAIMGQLAADGAVETQTVTEFTRRRKDVEEE